jgi:hypothetical protein
MNNTPNPFEFFQQFWKQTTMGNSHFTPPLSIEEIEQKIAELVTVEQWLKMQLTMVENGIKILEMQKAGLAAFTEKPKQPPVET